jgi:Uma2 family endonuclease
MSVELLGAPAVASENCEQRFVIGNVSFDAYVRISEALDDHPGLRMIYCDGRLVFVGKSRRHDWFAERLGEFVKAVARGLGIPWEDAGQATFRRENMDAGLEGDKTFYFRGNAVLMRGPVDVDLAAQPPPDLAIEVEVSHSADAALFAWGRLGIPEVWRFQPKTGEFRFCVRAQDGTYATVERSLAFPSLSIADVLQQLTRANELGADRWNEQLPDWVDRVIRPRLTGDV